IAHVGAMARSYAFPLRPGGGDRPLSAITHCGWPFWLTTFNRCTVRESKSTTLFVGAACRPPARLLALIWGKIKTIISPHSPTAIMVSNTFVSRSNFIRYLSYIFLTYN